MQIVRIQVFSKELNDVCKVYNNVKELLIEEDVKVLLTDGHIPAKTTLLVTYNKDEECFEVFANTPIREEKLWSSVKDIKELPTIKINSYHGMEAFAIWQQMNELAKKQMKSTSKAE